MDEKENGTKEIGKRVKNGRIDLSAKRGMKERERGRRERNTKRRI